MKGIGADTAAADRRSAADSPFTHSRARLYRHGGAPLPWSRAFQSLVVVGNVSLCHPRRYSLRVHVIHTCLIVVASRVGGVVGYFHRPPPKKNDNTVPLHTYQRMVFASAIAATDKCCFFRPKRRKQAFIGRQNKRPSSAVLLPDAVARWRGRRVLLQSPFGCHEVNFAEKRLPSAIPITGRRFTHVFEQCTVCCIAFRLLYRIIVICSRFCWCILY